MDRQTSFESTSLDESASPELHMQHSIFFENERVSTREYHRVLFRFPCLSDYPSNHADR